MSEYIEREAAYNAIVNNYTTDAQLCDLDGILAANVVEVRYGQWIDHEKDGFPLPTTCSRCFYPIDRFYKSNFCPNCGADMREQEKETGE